MVYIVRTSGNTLYVGQTNNLHKRLAEHARKKSRGAKYLSSFTSFELVYTEQFPTRSLALKREYELKQLTHKEKEALLVK
ncbi:TPA: hypothetical protein DIV55_04875 [Patescibacteria group bacterium]|nr:hypothetical protein [Patescibacteria group bacterium]